MYIISISTLFNPLVSCEGQNGWLEDLATSPSITTNPNEDAEAFVSMFGFENINDASQGDWLGKGMATFTENAQFWLARSFQLQVNLSKTEVRQMGIHCIGTDAGVNRIEEVMRGVFENSGSRPVDTTYCFPNLRGLLSRDIDLLGWLESRTGSFVFTDQKPFQRMSAFLNVPKA